MLRTLSFALLLAPAISAAAPIKASPPITVRGQVTKPDGSPADGTSIIVKQKRELLLLEEPFHTVAETRSDKHGAYQFNITLEQYASVELEHPDFAKMQLTLYDDFNMFGNVMQPRLEPRTIVRNVQLAPCAKLSGRITNDRGDPIAGAGLSASPVPPYHEMHAEPVVTTSTSDGHFVFTKAPFGKLKLVVRPEQHVPFSTEVKAPANDVKVQVSSAGAIIMGRVVDAETSTPVTNARVSLRQWSDGTSEVYYWTPIYTTTNGEGAYRFDHLPAGRFLLGAEANGRHAVPVESDSLRLVKVGPDDHFTGHDIAIYAGHTILGLVADRSTSSPIAGAVVTFGLSYNNETITSTTTDASGRYQVEGIFSSWRKGISVRVSHPGYRMALDRSSAESTRVDLSTRPSPMFEQLDMLPTVQVHGRIVRPDGTAAAGALVALQDDRQNWPGRVVSAISDETGAFVLETDGNAECNLVYEAPGFARSATKIQASATSASTLTLQLNVGREIRGSVLDASGHPVAVALVTAYSGTCVAQAYSGVDGKFVFPKVTTDSLTLRVRKQPELPEIDGPAIAADGSHHEIVLRFPKRYSITGRVTDEQGKPAAGVNVSAHGLGYGPSYGSAETDELGNYRIDNLLEGGHTVSVASQLWKATDLQAKSGSQNIDFRVRTTPPVRLVCHVVDARTKQPMHTYTVERMHETNFTVERSAPDEFRIANLHAGEYFILSLTAPGCVPLRKEIRVPENVAEYEETIEMGAPGTLEGAVCFRDLSRTPAPRSAVNVVPASILNQFDDRRNAPGNIVYTDENGRFRKEGLAPGEYSIELVQVSNGSRGSITAQVIPGMMVQAPALLLDRPQRIYGQLFRLVGVPDVRITMQRSDTSQTAEVVTQADGTFEIPDVTEGEHRISYEGSEPATFGVNREDTLQFTWLDQDQALEGTVIRNGQPVADVQVELVREPVRFLKNKSQVAEYAGGPPYAGPTVTSPDGTFRLKGLLPGRWRARLTKFDAATSVDSSGSVVGDTGDQAARPAPSPTALTPLRERTQPLARRVIWAIERDVSVNSDPLTTCSIVVPGGTLSGVAMDESSRPLAGANISLRIATGQPLSITREALTTTDRDGRFVVDALAEGKYSIQAVAQDGRYFGNAEALVTTAPADVEVKLVECHAQILPVIHSPQP